SRRRHTRFSRDWSSDVCSSDLETSLHRPRPRAARDAARSPVPEEHAMKYLLAILLASLPALALAQDWTVDHGNSTLGFAGTYEEIGRASCRGRAEYSAVAA